MAHEGHGQRANILVSCINLHSYWTAASGRGRRGDSEIEEVPTMIHIIQGTAQYQQESGQQAELESMANLNHYRTVKAIFYFLRAPLVLLIRHSVLFNVIDHS